MEAGQLRELISIIQPPTALSAAGEPSGEWPVFAKVWARVEPLRGRQLEAARTVYADVTVVVTTRWVAGILPKMCILHGQKRYQIDSVVDIGSRNRELEILCSEAQ
jgi:SPP1 family predicted phage head-tail adaptor